MNCPNCGVEITCSCQRRIASDGTACCEKCVMGYQQKLHLKQLKSTTVKEDEGSVISYEPLPQEQVININATTIT